MRTTSGPKHIAGLDLIRFGAAMLVVAHHFGWAVWGGQRAFPVTYEWLGAYTWFGFVGVEIFFVLSGFVIAYSAANSTASLFLVNRVKRLYPAAWICATITLLVVAGTHSLGLKLAGTPIGTDLARKYLDSLALFPFGPWIDGVYWTLAVESIFYALVFVLLATRRFHLLVRIVTAAGALNTLCFALLFAVEHRHLTETSALYSVATFYKARFIVILALGHHASLFAIGVLLWACSTKGVTALRVAGILLCGAGAAMEVRVRSLGVAAGHPNWSWHTPLFVWLAALLLIILSIRENQLIHDSLRPFGLRIARSLGLLTYPLYLVHEVAGFAILRCLTEFLPDLAALVIVVLIAIATAYVINRFLERPLQKMMGRALNDRTRFPSPASSAP